MRFPISYAVFRGIAAAFTFLTLLFAALGLAGHGPLGGAAGLVAHTLAWLSEYTRVRL
jgi:hypothetical protein